MALYPFALYFNARNCNSGKNTYVTLQSASELSHVPERMICLELREKSHFTLCCSFPGACLSFEVVESQLRLEANHSSQLYPFANSQEMNSDVSCRGSAVPVIGEYISLFLKLWG